MTLIAWIIVGLVAALLSRLVMPPMADEPESWLGTMLTSLAGAILGGASWNVLLAQPMTAGVHMGSVLVAFAGSCLLIGLRRLFRRRHPSPDR
jgi:uncharacterized membrane protein YeaQ/YmgE (transglycosylase-associated protein family)